MNQTETQKIYLRYMEGVGLRCLARAYHQSIKQIYDSIREHQANLDSQGGQTAQKATHRRPRAERVLPKDNAAVVKPRNKTKHKSKNKNI